LRIPTTTSNCDPDSCVFTGRQLRRIDICAKEKKVRKKRSKNPVLTSPWKIGTFVALMLVAVSTGVGYYLVRTYNINLRWLGTDTTRWVVDSYEFFRQVYPLLAGVIVVSLFSYFVIATAVRRYKYYLDSGQDYRHMLSLAGSIDDLTNPAQIAKLSNYPELQEILRNYGDQINEISRDMDMKEETMRSVDLEMEIDSILRGGEIQEVLVEGKWWASIARKVAAYVKDIRPESTETTAGDDEARKASKQAVVSCGKIIETATGAGEDMQEIVGSLEELSGTVSGMDGNGPSCESADVINNASTVAAMENIENSTRKLEEGGRVINEFSEETNGLALNIALMAARGDITERDLAQFAEKVRSTSERFGKLGHMIDQVAHSLSENCRIIGTVTGGASSEGSVQGADIAGAVGDISSRMETRVSLLRDKISAISYDIGNVKKVLQSGLGEDLARSDEEEIEIVGAGDSHSIFNENDSMVDYKAAEGETVEDDDPGFSIDHGGMWVGMEKKTTPAAGDEAIGNDDPGFADFTDSLETMKKDAGIEEPDGTLTEPEPTASEETLPDETDYKETATEETMEEETVDPFCMEADQEFKVDEPEKMNVSIDTAPVGDISQADESEQMSQDNDEPIHDLFDLGAVEYSEEGEKVL
jgi:methyl-accepting chemotaxis protein